MFVELKQIMIIVTVRLLLADDAENLCRYEVVLTIKLVADRLDDTCNFRVFNLTLMVTTMITDCQNGNLEIHCQDAANDD